MASVPTMASGQAAAPQKVSVESDSSATENMKDIESLLTWIRVSEK